MVDTGAGAKNIFNQAEKILIEDMHHQAHGYFGLIGIGNVGNKVLPKPLVVSDLKNLARNAQEVQNLYDNLSLDMIDKVIEGLKKTLNKPRLH